MRKWVLAALLPFVISAPVQAEENAPKPRIGQMGEGEATPFPGHTVLSLVSGADLPANISLLELDVPPKTVAAPPHIHSNEDEIFVVLEGGVTFLNGDKSVPAAAGAVASLPRGHWHGFWNPHDAPAKLLLIIAPAQFETFFDEVVMKIRAENPGSPEAVGAIIGQTAAARNVQVDPTRFPPEALALMPK